MKSAPADLLKSQGKITIFMKRRSLHRRSRRYVLWRGSLEVHYVIYSNISVNSYILANVH
jgi:hypothetical protein